MLMFKLNAKIKTRLIELRLRQAHCSASDDEASSVRQASNEKNSMLAKKMAQFLALSF